MHLFCVLHYFPILLYYNLTVEVLFHMRPPPDIHWKDPHDTTDELEHGSLRTNHLFCHRSPHIQACPTQLISESEVHTLALSLSHIPARTNFASNSLHILSAAYRNSSIPLSFMILRTARTLTPLSSEGYCL